ncbi:MAG: hypothetical protein R3E86_12225 [Pseudomonadales bacterium]
MNQDALISDIIERLQSQLRGLAPTQTIETVLEQARGAMGHALADFDLVSKRELEGHLRALEHLNAKVAELEQRLRELEQGS